MLSWSQMIRQIVFRINLEIGSKRRIKSEQACQASFRSELETFGYWSLCADIRERKNKGPPSSLLPYFIEGLSESTCHEPS